MISPKDEGGNKRMKLESEEFQEWGLLLKPECSFYRQEARDSERCLMYGPWNRHVREEEKQAAEVIAQTGASPRGGSNFTQGIRVSPDQHLG